jgi:heptosyltransferase-1
VKILLVKLSSLGDVVHTMPVVQDIRAALPGAQVDWVVEQSFVPLVQRCRGVQEVIGCELRRWRKAPLASHTRSAWRGFSEALRSRAYDAVIDLQGLTKSALVARAARLTAQGRRFALGNRTEGSSYEAPTRWVADVAVPMPAHVHAVTRARELCARALGYELSGEPRFGLGAQATGAAAGDPAGAAPCVALVHGSSRPDKCWPEAHWLELGRRLMAQGFTLGLPHGDDLERERAQRLAAVLGGQAQAWPRLDLGALTDRMAGCAGVVGVDSGLSHMAVALDLRHVQIYNFETAWRTGPLCGGEVITGEAPPPHAATCRQLAVQAQPTPSVDAVWQAWRQVQPRP